MKTTQARAAISMRLDRSRAITMMDRERDDSRRRRRTAAQGSSHAAWWRRRISRGDQTLAVVLGIGFAVLPD